MTTWRAGVSGVEVRLLDEEAVTAGLDMNGCITEVERGFAALASGQVPAPGVLSMHNKLGAYHIKAAQDDDWFVAKVNANYPRNHARGLPTIQGLVVVFDAASGSPVALIDSAELTARRTGAATGVAVKHLARAGDITVTLIGCGRQAEAQLAAVSSVRRIERVFVFDAERASADRLAARVASRYPVIPIDAAEMTRYTHKSDVVITCTPATQPFLDVDAIAPGCLVAAVGADNPHKSEIMPALMAKSRVVVDVLAQCEVMGDLHHAIAAGVMTRADVVAELGEVVLGGKAGRVGDDDIIVFDSTGMALQDIAAVRVLLRV